MLHFMQNVDFYKYLTFLKINKTIKLFLLVTQKKIITTCIKCVACIIRKLKKATVWLPFLIVVSNITSVTYSRSSMRKLQQLQKPTRRE